MLWWQRRLPAIGQLGCDGHAVNDTTLATVSCWSMIPSGSPRSRRSGWTRRCSTGSKYPHPAVGDHVRLFPEIQGPQGSFEPALLNRSALQERRDVLEYPHVLDRRGTGSSRPSAIPRMVVAGSCPTGSSAAPARQPLPSSPLLAPTCCRTRSTTFAADLFGFGVHS